MLALDSGTFGRYSSHESGTLMNGISDLIKEAPEKSLAPYTIEDTVRRPSYEQRRGPSPNFNYVSTLILDFEPLEL